MSSDTKKQLHPRNPHNASYDFDSLKKLVPELSEFIEITPGQDQSIDFSNPEAVKVLNQALLKQTYKVAFWDIPEGYLCPAIPGRADYIHYIADLLADLNDGNPVRVRKSLSWIQVPVPTVFTLSLAVRVTAGRLLVLILIRFQ